MPLAVLPHDELIEITIAPHEPIELATLPPGGPAVAIPGEQAITSPARARSR